VRFFFDYTKEDESLYDYRGDEFTNSKAAFEFATEIALNLRHSLTTDWIGWSVEVRSAEGEKFYSLSVATADMLAA